MSRPIPVPNLRYEQKLCTQFLQDIQQLHSLAIDALGNSALLDASERCPVGTAGCILSAVRNGKMRIRIAPDELIECTGS